MRIPQIRVAEMDAYDYAASRLDDGTLKRIDSFWEVFADQAEAIEKCLAAYDGLDTGRLMPMMRTALRPVSKDLMWEFEVVDIGHALTVTAEWRDELRPLTRLLLQRAPNLPRWQFHETRQPIPAEQVIVHAKARLRSDLAIIEIQPTAGEDRAVNLDVSGPTSEDELVNQSILLFSLLKGEALDRIWLGEISGSRPTLMRSILAGDDPASDLDFELLINEIDECIDDARELAPGAPFCDVPLDAREVSLLEPAEPGQGPSPRDDLITLTSTYPEMIIAQLNGNRFASERFSRFGETFAMLRFTRTDGRFGDVEERYNLEEKLQDALAEARSGGVTGGAFGQANAYIDVALLHVGDAIDTIGNVLRAEGIPTGTSLHFFEPGLDEFVVTI